MPHFQNQRDPQDAAVAGGDVESLHARFDKLEELYMAGIKHLKSVLAAKPEPVEVDPPNPAPTAPLPTEPPVFTSAVAPSLDAPLL